MTKVDYIIVGDGYAAFFFAHQLIKNNKRFVIFSEGRTNASYISAGIVNPVILKRFTPIWMSESTMRCFQKTLGEIKEYLNKEYFVPHNVLRIFHDDKERKLWNIRRGRKDLIDYLDPDFIFINEESINNPYFCGMVNYSGRLKVYDFFDDMRKYFLDHHFVVESRFDYAMLNTEERIYQNFVYQNIVFAEGVDVKDNPYFGQIPVNANKGHHLIVKIDSMPDVKYIIKNRYFLFPLQEGKYYYGSTYDRISHESGIENHLVEELKKGIRQFYRGSFEIEQVHSGFRATVRDRRPIIGKHRDFENLYILNGLGARGILNGCFFSKELYEHIELGKPILPEVDVHRFY